MSRNTSRIVWAIALAGLICALVCFNLPAAPQPAAEAETPALPPDAGEETPAQEQPAYTSDAPLGCEVGEQLPDFTLTTLSGEAFTLSEHRGTVTVLNLWATWCAPCVKELPYFDELQARYPQDVTVLAIHSDLVTSDPAAYLAAFDYQIPFAVDETGSVAVSMGDSAILPQTVVLDPYGVVVYNRSGSVTYEALEELVQSALNAEH